MTTTINEIIIQKDRQINRLKQIIEQKDKRIADVLAGREEFPEKYKDVIDQILKKYPTVTMTDILKHGGTRYLNSVRKECWRAILSTFPEASVTEVARHFRRHHTVFFEANRNDGWTR